MPSADPRKALKKHRQAIYRMKLAQPTLWEVKALKGIAYLLWPLVFLKNVVALPVRAWKRWQYRRLKKAYNQTLATARAAGFKTKHLELND